MLDDRLLRITIFINDEDGELVSKHVFEKLAMSAVGSKFSSEIANVCEIRIANVDKPTRELLLTDGSPYGRLARANKNSVLVEAGRVSTDFYQVYIGDITSVGVTSPPDIQLVISTTTGKHRKNETIALNRDKIVTYRTLAAQASGLLKLSLSFQAPDKDIANFSFSGSTGKLVKVLGLISEGVDAYVDDDTLVVKPRFDTSSTVVTQIDVKNGLVDIPTFIDIGVRCKVLLGPEVRLGEKINLVSEAYPLTSGEYLINRLGFNLANRDTPFYYTLDTSRKDLVLVAAVGSSDTEASA